MQGTVSGTVIDVAVWFKRFDCVIIEGRQKGSSVMSWMIYGAAEEYMDTSSRVGIGLVIENRRHR